MRERRNENWERVSEGLCISDGATSQLKLRVRATEESRGVSQQLEPAKLPQLANNHRKELSQCNDNDLMVSHQAVALTTDFSITFPNRINFSSRDTCYRECDVTEPRVC